MQASHLLLLAETKQQKRVKTVKDGSQMIAKINKNASLEKDTHTHMPAVTQHKV